MAEETATRRTKAARLPPLRISRAFSVSRAALFAAWSSADRVKRWFSPGSYTVLDATVDMRVGGVFNVRLRGPYGGERLIRGTFVEVIPHDRLVIDMAVADTEGARLFKAVTKITFAEDAVGARMDVVQNYALVDPAVAVPMVWGASEGWRTALDRLAEEVARMRGEATCSVTHATVRLERFFEVRVARVWAALTEEQAKSKWFGGPPAQWELVERQMEVRVGGRERLRGRWKGGVISTFEAIYYDVVPNERLVYAFEMRLDEARTSVSLATVQFGAEGARSRLVITEQGAFLDGYGDAVSRERDLGRQLDALGASLED